MQNSLQKYKKIHFVGIGGIGLSALAGFLQKFGHEITGSDQSTNYITENLKKIGIKIYSGHNAKNLTKNTNLLIYTLGINKNNPEFLEAKKLKIRTLSYPQALGLLTKSYDLVSVAGTHGKTTTTSFITLSTTNSKSVPSAIVGSLIPEIGNKNYQHGNNSNFILESCEYKNAYHNYSPKISVITNIEPDHLDFFKTKKKYLESFSKFLILTKKSGIIIYNKDDKELSKLISNIKKERGDLTFISFGKSKSANYQIKDKAIYKTRKKIASLKLKIPGEHNIYNATPSIVLADLFKTLNTKTLKKINNFKGAGRRYEIIGKIKGTTLIDDYAHHPTAVQKTLEALKNNSKKTEKILAVFQPHQYSRTLAFLKQYAVSFKNCDKVIIPNIYEARDSKADIKKMPVKRLVSEINKKDKDKALDGVDFETTKIYIQKNYKNYKTIIFMGAGSISAFAKSLSNSIN